MKHHNCPHGNGHCSPSSLCTPCRGNGVLQDGESVSVRMMFRDDAPPQAREQMARASAALRGTDNVGDMHAAAIRCHENMRDRVQAYADHWEAKSAADAEALAKASPRDRAYAGMVESLSQGRRG